MLLYNKQIRNCQIRNITNKYPDYKTYINILGINEMRWPNNGDFMINDFKMIYAGDDKHEKVVGLLLDNNMAKCMLGGAFVEMFIIHTLLIFC